MVIHLRSPAVLMAGNVSCLDVPARRPFEMPSSANGGFCELLRSTGAGFCELLSSGMPDGDSFEMLPAVLMAGYACCLDVLIETDV